MSYNLQLTLRNSGSQPVNTIIYGGTVFEVLDPFLGVQNLAVIRNTPVVIPPGTSTVVHVDTWCTNQSYDAPGDTSMRLTSLQLADTYDNQRELWEDLNSRR